MQTDDALRRAGCPAAHEDHCRIRRRDSHRRRSYAFEPRQQLGKSDVVALQDDAIAGALFLEEHIGDRQRARQVLFDVRRDDSPDLRARLDALHFLVEAIERHD